MKVINVAFRVDGGSGVGLGHIIRCLSLANEFRKKGHNVVFFSKLELGINRIELEGFDVIRVSNTRDETDNGFYYGDLNELDNEMNDISIGVQKHGIDLLIIDSYNVSERYFLGLKKFVKKLVYIDDVNRFVYPVDILVNGNINGEYLNYKKFSHDEILLLGPQFNMIRDEFRELPDRTISQKVENIMITTGGSDPFNLSDKIVSILLEDFELKHLNINIIIGDGFRNTEALKKIQRSNKNVILHENAKSMSQIMKNSDIAISSGGSTLYELCACGTPTLAFILADNQKNIVEKLDRLGYVINIGWHTNLSSEQLTRSVKLLMHDFNMRKLLCEKGRKLVDANGTKRIVEVVEEVLGGYLNG